MTLGFLPIVFRICRGGWLVLEFVGKPFRKFFDMKREALESLNNYGNVTVPVLDDDLYLPTTDSSKKRFREAREAFRTHGSRFLAFASTEWFAVVALNAMGYSPEAAGRGFIGLSNSLGEYGVTRHNNRDAIEKALKAA
jgi:hypothetical protein